MRRILFVNADLASFWSHRLELARGARNAGWDVHVCAPGADRDPRMGEHGLTGHDLPNSEDMGYLRASVAQIFALRELCRKLGPDIVHAITIKVGFVAGIALPRDKQQLVLTIAGLGYLFTGEGLSPRLLRSALRPLLRYAIGGPGRSVIFQNPDDEKVLCEGVGVRPSRRVVIEGSGVDVARFAPPPAPPQNDRVRVLMPTRLIREKGVEVFAESARLLRDRGVEADCIVAGGLAPTNPNAISTEEMQTLCVRTGVIWLGHIPDMVALYQSSDIVAYPSYYGEGVPKTLLEAAACGLPVVTTDSPGCREAVTEGLNGFLVPPKDPVALADRIEGLARDPALREKLGISGRRRALEAFDVSLIVARTLAFYDAVGHSDR